MRRLSGEGLVLEPQIEAHAGELYAVLDDPELYVFTDDKGPARKDALAARLAKLESRRSPDGTERWLNWVVRTDEGAMVGYVQATVRAGNVAEIAYVLGRTYWRRGYATAACRMLLAELRDTYRVERAVATLDPQNSASLALLRKLGFRPLSESFETHELTYELTLFP